MMRSLFCAMFLLLPMYACVTEPDPPGGAALEVADTDGDGISDAVDNCAWWNPDQADLDGDGAGDLCDACPEEPRLTELTPGCYGCAVDGPFGAVDDDGDGALNCHEACDDNPDKHWPTTCGLCAPGPDPDGDGDGWADCVDSCDFDSDGDGTADCDDACNYDPTRSAPGADGCGWGRPSTQLPPRDLPPPAEVADLQICTAVDSWEETCYSYCAGGGHVLDTRTCSYTECCRAVFDPATEQWDWVCASGGVTCGHWWPPPF